jgi:hypothetical protein
MDTEMIFKLQQSIQTSDGIRKMLIYNEDKSIYYEAPITDEIRELMGDNLKIFVKGRLQKSGNIRIDRALKQDDF